MNSISTPIGREDEEMSSFHKTFICIVLLTLTSAGCSLTPTIPPTEKSLLPTSTKRLANTETLSPSVEGTVVATSEEPVGESLEAFTSDLIDAFKSNDFMSLDDMITEDIESWLGVTEIPDRKPGKGTYLISIQLEGGYQACEIFFLDATLANPLQVVLKEPDVAAYGVIDCDPASNRF
jgi:hypothetical protein